MKRFILLLGFFAAFQVANAQPVEPQKASKFSADYYLKKSRKQKTTAWIMLGGGLVASTAGMFMAVDDDIGDYHDYPNFLYTVFIYGGAGCVFGSIPLFIAGARNKGKSMRASAGFKMEQLKNPQLLGASRSSYPAISVKFNLR